MSVSLKLTPMVRFPNRTGIECPINSKLYHNSLRYENAANNKLPAIYTTDCSLPQTRTICLSYTRRMFHHQSCTGHKGQEGFSLKR